MAYKIPVTKDDFIKINESEQSEKNKQTEKSEQLKEKVDYYLDILKKYDGKTFGDIAEDKYGNERLDYDTRSDEELYSLAKNYADAFKGEKESEITQKGEKEKNKYLSQMETVTQKSQDEEEKLTKNYETEVKKSKDGAIKKGIARSSIIENLLKEYGKGYTDAKASVKNEEKSKLDALNKQISTLESDIEKALKTLDMQSAVELNDKLTELKEEKNRTNKKIAEYNAKVDDKITNYANELKKTEDGQAIADFVLNRSGKYVVDGKKALLEYIDSLPLEQAYAQADNEEWDYYFGKGTSRLIKSYLDDKAKNTNAD
ncbi:MAG: hypothetical protein IKT32_04645 [Clostridia bacterium]|nr:hypothetical protein [Clostridia bacterium]